jgi:hypothetical protein
LQEVVFSITMSKITLLVESTHGEVLTFVDWCTAGCEAHMNFADELTCLLAGNLRNEVVTIRRLQEALKILLLYM